MENTSELPNVTEYAIVKGYVEPVHDDLESNYKNSVRGVIRLHEIVAHGTKKEKNLS
jgi:hypothetical protein